MQPPPTLQDSRDRANARAASWRCTEQTYRSLIRERNRQAWIEFHLTQAASVLEGARVLSEKHVAAAVALVKEYQEGDD